MSEVTSSSVPTAPSRASNLAPAGKTSLTPRKEPNKPPSAATKKKVEIMTPTKTAITLRTDNEKSNINYKKLHPTQLPTSKQLESTQNAVPPDPDKKEPLVSAKPSSNEPGKSPKQQSPLSEKLQSARAPNVMLTPIDKDETHGPDQQKKKKRKWYQLHWSSIGLSVCLSVSLIDPSQVDLLSKYSRANGGLYFLLIYFVAVWVVQMPITFLFVHLGQYTQVGLTKVTNLFGHCFRGIGWAMFAWLLVSQAVTLQDAAERFDHAITMGPLLDDFVSCRMRDVDCFTNPYLDSCCISLASQMACKANYSSEQCYQEDIPVPMLRKMYYEKEEDLTYRPEFGLGAGDRIQRPPSEMFWKSETLRTSATFGRSAITTVTMIICAILASTGCTIFAIIFSGLGILTYILIFINCGYLVCQGHLSQGIQRVVSLTEPERLFTRETLFAMVGVVIVPVNLKFFTVSIARLRTKRSEAFATAAMMTIVHLLVNICFLVANYSMTGWLETAAKEHDAPTSITAIAGHVLRRRNEYWHNFLPEYFSLANKKGFYTWFCFCHFLMHIFPILGSFFTLLELKKSHPTFATKVHMIVLNIVACCTYAGAILLLACLFQLYPNVVGRYFGWSHYTGCVILLLFCHITVRFYGADELYIDLCFVYPITKTFHDYYGPLSKTFRSLLGAFCPLILVLVTSFQLDMKFVFEIEMHDEDRSKFFELVLPGIAYYTLIAFFGFDLGTMLCMAFKKSRRREIWKMIYPTEEHPSHLRIMKDRQREQQPQTNEAELSSAAE